MSAFTNEAGQLRAGWRLALWYAMVLGMVAVAQTALGFVLRGRPFLDPIRLLVGDAGTGIPVLIATLVMMSIERRSWRDYCWPSLGEMFGRRFWAGLLWGFAAISLDVGLIAAFGGYRISALALSGAALAKFTMLWVAASMAIGVVEEFYFRAYQLRTLADGVGFWPAAIINSLAFGALHYFQKPYERWEDWASVSLLGLFLCLTVRRTGTLAFAIGWHAAFDWGAIYFWSGRNAGEFAVGHLIDTHWSDSQRLTGGMLGPEASWMMGIVIAVLFTAFVVIYRSRRLTQMHAGHSR